MIIKMELLFLRQKAVNVSEGNCWGGVIHNDTIIEPSAQWEKT